MYYVSRGEGGIDVVVVRCRKKGGGIVIVFLLDLQPSSLNNCVMCSTTKYISSGGILDTLYYTVGYKIQDYTVEYKIQDYTVEYKIQDYTVESKIQDYTVEYKIQDYTVEYKIQDYTVE